MSDPAPVVIDIQARALVSTREAADVETSGAHAARLRREAGLELRARLPAGWTAG